MLPLDILVLGSQNAKTVDQELPRNQIYPVQLLRENGALEPISFFNEWGEVGVSSIAWHPDFKDELFVSINTEIRRLNSKTKEFKVLDIPHLADIHDIEVLGDTLWISNTEFDEAIAYDVHSDKVEQRISLDEYRTKAELEEGEEAKDRFHCNQVFRNYEDKLSVLIHNVNGWQFFRVVLEMIVRRQGDGGVIDLENKVVKNLKLQSPHSVRKIAGNYWIQDSGDKTTKVFDKNWKPVATIDNGGFGRGVAFSEEHDLAFVGLSATRKRYLRIIPSAEKLKNRVLSVSISTLKPQKAIELQHIEQVDNLYVYEGQLKETLERFL